MQGPITLNFRQSQLQHKQNTIEFMTGHLYLRNWVAAIFSGPFCPPKPLLIYRQYL